jgi:nucleotide-binding universal stress UspA family protein
MYTHLLLVTDRTPYSDKVIADGIRFAKAIGAKVTIFTAISPWIGPEFSLVVRSDDTDSYARIIADNVERCLARGSASAKQAGVPCATLSTKSEKPWKAIIEAATSERCDLIVMASHGSAGIEAVLLGSETQKVLAHTRLPVLVHR